MILRLIVLFSFLFIIGLRQDYPNNPVATFIVADSIKTEVSIVLDSAGQPDKYWSRLVTPVCENDKCYIIELDVYWDLIGRYQNYDTIEGVPLTKLDHIPFLQEDYKKLQAILIDKNSALGKYHKEELVQHTRSSEIDGFTGATIAELKERIVEGAVYSCYTLWHIVHGGVVDSLHNTTMRLLDEDLVHKLVSQNDQHINYFLINNFSEAEFSKYIRDILYTIRNGKGYYPKNTIAGLPGRAMQDSLVQSFFAEHFINLNYFAQVALLEKLEGVSLTNDLEKALLTQRSDRNSYKNELIDQLVSGKGN